jgi:Sporulation related domain.
MPMEVKILGGEETQLDLGVTRSVLISGTVVLYGSKEQALGDTTTSNIDLGGKSGVFLELTNGTDYNRRVTDNHGRFSFADIRPGKWSLNVIGGDVPEYHVILPDTTAIDAQPGDKKEITIEIRPKRRTIKILQEGAIIQEAPAKPEKKVELPAATKQTVLPCIVWYDIHRKGYVLQISSWFTKSKALRVAKIAERISGMKSYTITVRIPSLGKRTRVFLGVFKTQKAAEEMCLKLMEIE